MALHINTCSERQRELRLMACRHLAGASWREDLNPSCMPPPHRMCVPRAMRPLWGALLLQALLLSGASAEEERKEPGPGKCHAECTKHG